MQNYLTHLLSDIEAATLHRWQKCPPHYYQMGLPERYLEPTAGWDGPPLGYARNDDDSLDDFFAELESGDALSNPLPPDEIQGKCVLRQFAAAHHEQNQPAKDEKQRIEGPSAQAEQQ